MRCRLNANRDRTESLSFRNAESSKKRDADSHGAFASKRPGSKSQTEERILKKGQRRVNRRGGRKEETGRPESRSCERASEDCGG